jgi:hypothetical protein
MITNIYFLKVNSFMKLGFNLFSFFLSQNPSNLQTKFGLTSVLNVITSITTGANILIILGQTFALNFY